MNDCNICMSSLEGLGTVCNLSCGHSFHTSCHLVWFLSQVVPSCACCRRPIQSCEHHRFEQKKDHNNAADYLAQHPKRDLAQTLLKLQGQIQEQQKTIQETRD